MDSVFFFAKVVSAAQACWKALGIVRVGLRAAKGWATSWLRLRKTVEGQGVEIAALKAEVETLRAQPPRQKHVPFVPEERAGLSWMGN
jgi:hypothetical protein